MVVGLHITCSKCLIDAVEGDEAGGGPAGTGVADGSRAEDTFTEDFAGIQNVLKPACLCAHSILIRPGWISEAFVRESRHVQGLLFSKRCSEAKIRSTFRRMSRLLARGERQDNIVTPPQSKVSGQKRTILRNKLQSPHALSSDELQDIKLEEKKIVLFQRSADYDENEKSIEARNKDNVITLYPGVFRKGRTDTIKGLYLEDENILRLDRARTFTILHEIAHCRPKPGAGDLLFPVRDMPVWIRNEFHEDHDFVWFDKQGRPACICYGYTLPVLLARTDNTRFREWSVHNAENWALYASILFAMLVYPELDFTGEWIEARPAGELLHHNSMFSCFRSEGKGGVDELLGYEANKDNFWQQYGDWRGKTVDDLLDILESASDGSIDD